MREKFRTLSVKNGYQTVALLRKVPKQPGWQTAPPVTQDTPDLPETGGSEIENPQTNPNSPSGLAEGSGTVLEEESPATPEVGVFSFEGTQNGGNFASPEDPNTLPESIENPER